jgi:DNA-directed RNA polymerase II subunit RPB2
MAKKSSDEKKSVAVDKWSIIDTYFRDTDYYKSQHQLDSFDEFIYSETNGIQHIIKRGNPVLIYKEPLNSDGTEYKYEIEIYFGETLTDDGELDEKVENINVSLPVEYIDGDTKYMYPNIARLKGYTYKSNIFCSIGVKYKNNETNVITIKNFPKINIGSIPIMLHSKQCVLRRLDNVKLSELGECPYDQGGYFIINGKEKVIISQEIKVNNILYINKSSVDNILLQATVKSVSKEGFQSSRTNMIYLQEIKINIKDSYKVEKITVRALGFDIHIPLFIMFRALGFESDKSILSFIIQDNDNDDLKTEILNIIRYSIKEAQPVYSQRDALRLLALNTKGKDIIHVIDILNNNLFPHYNTHREKGLFLAYTIRQLLLTHLGIIKETDRDSYSNKRIDLAGPLLLELYRELWGNYIRNCTLKIDHEYKFNFKEGHDFSNIINEQNFKRIFDSKIMDNISKSFGASFGTGISARKGIVQDLNRISMLGTLSHIRRLSYPLPAGSKTIGPRKLHNSQWGFVCPSESPDGGNVGIINHLSIIAKVSINIEESSVYDALIDHRMKPIKDIISSDLNDNGKIFLNGRFIGIHKNPPLLTKIMKLLKLNSIINCFTSISWNTYLNEIYIFCDSGRIVRPVFVLRDDLSNDLISGSTEKIENWSKCIHGFIYTLYPQISIYDNTYHRDVLNELKGKKDFMKELEKHQSPIEYIDSLESDYSFIAKDYRSIDKQYTHCEIESSLILSAVTLNIPFPEHSQAPRNVFSSQQTKQAVGVYSSAYNTRFDTFGHIHHYPQKSIVTTRYKKYTDVDKLPYGCNCIVAIASYSGYNQEDAVILNKSSVDRGMFQTIYYRSYEDSEELTNNNHSYFANPKYQSNVQKKNLSSFAKLDVNGFIKEGEHVTSDDMITGKCMKIGNTTSVSGSSIKFGTYGTVDKVIIFKNKDNLRTCKVRVRKHKIPEIGDKFSSRPGQKGVCGLLIDEKDMPFSKDGIVPDLIINPHAIPSRMTINQLLEMILGKSCSLTGHLGDATPFQNNDINDYTKLLSKLGYDGYGNEVLYSGITGEQIRTSIFMGPIYYQRIKIMVADKMHSRGTGPVQAIVRQPAGGRANNGGLRIGEMERDSILSHGLSSFLNESMMERSDKYEFQINENTGLIDYQDNESIKHKVQVPYALKMLIQELQTMCIYARFETDTHIPNKPVFQHLINNLLG